MWRTHFKTFLDTELRDKWELQNGSYKTLTSENYLKILTNRFNF